VRLRDLFAGVEDWRLGGPGEVDVSALAYRSDQAVPGSLFFCVPGLKSDGHDYAPDAVARGSVALCVQRALDLPVPQVVVPSVRHVMGPVASVFYGEPSRRLLTAGVTGTNGKTTSAFLAAHLLDQAGLPAGLLGTVERRIGGRSLPAGRTTPESLDIQRDLAEMVQAGDKGVVMEVSSHALDQGRALGIDFDVVAFTNLTQDHLDYHKTIEDYFAAKCRLFLAPELGGGRTLSVINVDDPFGLELARRCARERVISLSTRSFVAGWGAPDLEWSDFEMGAGGTRGSLVLRGTALRSAAGGVDAMRADAELHTPVVTRLLGVFNVSNTLTAFGIGLGLGLEPEGMVHALRGFAGVPGRMEAVDRGQGFTVLVDYAHTPDSVSNVLRTAREFTSGRLISLIGCGGDRDRGKRPLMGREAEVASDLVIVTSDNPRSEDPLAIIAEITAGLQSPDKAVVQPDRHLAIQEAIRLARPGDVVMILGKGHESGQEFAGGRTVPFDDRQVAREALQEVMGQGQ
jgi:UDP-N-acetylmuramoyl-L-alanyl-D-glutamate--2,6-diaminopimelate ligase